MNHVPHGHGLGIFAIVAAIAFAFGVQTARVIVGSVLIVALLFFLYVMYRVVAGTI